MVVKDILVPWCWVVTLKPFTTDQEADGERTQRLTEARAGSRAAPCIIACRAPYFCSISKLSRAYARCEWGSRSRTPCTSSAIVCCSAGTNIVQPTPEMHTAWLNASSKLFTPVGPFDRRGNPSQSNSYGHHLSTLLVCEVCVQVAFVQVGPNTRQAAIDVEVLRDVLCRAHSSCHSKSCDLHLCYTHKVHHFGNHVPGGPVSSTLHPETQDTCGTLYQFDPSLMRWLGCPWCCGRNCQGNGVWPELQMHHDSEGVALCREISGIPHTLE